MEIRFCENDTCKKPIPQFNKNGTKITEKVYKKRRFCCRKCGDKYKKEHNNGWYGINWCQK